MKDSTEKPVSDKKKRKSNLFLRLATYLWLPISFILPYSFTHHMASQDYVGPLPGRTKYTNTAAQWRVDAARTEAARSGTVGMIIALAIFMLWRLDRALGKDKREINSTWMVVVLGAFAVLLWIVWTCAGQVILRANDEISVSPPQFPGFD